ncbi:MAG TPA: hypothetical protein VIJ65_01095 [Acidobacteriaceae bacterium]
MTRSLMFCFRMFCFRRWFFVTTLFFGLSAVAAPAQIGLYGMGSGGRFTAMGGQGGSVTAWGGTVGVYDDFLPLGPVSLGGDVRGFIQSSSNSTQYGNKLMGGLVGLRLAVHVPAIPLRPYIQAEVGGVGTNNGDSASRTASVAYQVQGGLDVTVFPHLDLRGEYGAGQANSINNSGHTLQEFGAGIVLRL